MRPAFFVVMAASVSLAGGSPFPLYAQQQGGAKTEMTIPSQGEILTRLRKEHPRLLTSAAGFAELKERVSEDPQLKKWKFPCHLFDL